MNYYDKYLKYKSKYMKLKNNIIKGGGRFKQGTNVKLKDSTSLQGSNDFYVYADDEKNKSYIMQVETGKNYVVNDDDLELKSPRAEYQPFERTARLSHSDEYQPFERTAWLSHSDSYEYQPQHSEGTLCSICSICSRGILSEIHKDECDTISMWQNREQIIKLGKAFKPMMTFGLNGCTAALIAIKENENFIRVMLIHDPTKEKVAIYLMQKLNLYRDSKYSSYIIIRGPGDYQLNNEKWSMIAQDIYYWKDKFKEYDNIRFCIEGYNVSNTIRSNSSDTKLHCKLVGNELQYTNTYGKWTNIELCNTN